MDEQIYNPKDQKVWIMAGEKSGDIYGAELTRQLKRISSSLRIQGMGGREMRDAGVDILVDSSELGVVGLVEVIKNIGTFLQIFRFLVNKAERERPNVVVLVDYPGFNLRYAKKIHQLGIKLVYYISPQVWAWKASRIELIASMVTKMLVIFPFEKDIYRKTELETVFVGHPLVDIMQKKIDPRITRDDHLILLLPGSRFSEVDRLLRPMYEVASWLYLKDNNYRFVIAVPGAGIKKRVDEMLMELRHSSAKSVPIQVAMDETDFWMQKACVGLAASGTVTVQSAIFGLPLVVIYRVNPITYMIGRMLVKVPYITMVNLISGQMIYEEFLQDKVNISWLVPAMERILPDGDRRDQVLTSIKTVIKQLEGKGKASHNAAMEVLKVLEN